MLGLRTFYQWNGDVMPVVVCLSRQPHAGWAVDEMKGPRNAIVPEIEEARICERLTRAGVIRGPSFTRIVDDFHHLQHNIRPYAPGHVPDIFE